MRKGLLAFTAAGVFALIAVLATNPPGVNTADTPSGVAVGGGR